MIRLLSVADPGFSRGGCANPREGAILLFGQIFVKKCMKMKQESIQVECVPSAAVAVSRGGGVWTGGLSAPGGSAPGGCLLLGRCLFLRVSALVGCLLWRVSATGGVCSQGVSATRGVSALGGVSAPGGCLLWGSCLLRGGVYPTMH